MATTPRGAPLRRRPVRAAAPPAALDVEILLCLQRALVSQCGPNPALDCAFATLVAAMSDKQARTAEQRLRALLHAVRDLGPQADTGDILGRAELYMRPH